MQQVLVTGGAGFIGRHVVKELVQKQYHVSIIDLKPADRDFSDLDVHYYCADIKNDLNVIFEKEKPDFVIHLAAQVNVAKSLEDPRLDASTNVLGTINILETCYKHNVKKIIFASSAAVYGDPVYLPIDEEHPVKPTSFYGVSKLAAESYIKLFADLHKLNYSILRYANVYGTAAATIEPGNVISKFVDKLKTDNSPIIFGDGEQSRDFIYVKDVAKATVSAIRLGDRQTFNISTNKPTTLNELVEKLNELFNIEREITYLSPQIGDISHSYLSNQRARDKIEFESQFSLEKGLRFMIDEWKTK